MNYSIPANPEEMSALRQQNSVDEELVATAIAGVVQIAHSQGQSFDDLKAELLADDSFLDEVQRHWLSGIVAQAWDTFTEE